MTIHDVRCHMPGRILDLLALQIIRSMDQTPPFDALALISHSGQVMARINVQTVPVRTNRLLSPAPAEPNKNAPEGSPGLPGRGCFMTRENCNRSRSLSRMTPIPRIRVRLADWAWAGGSRSWTWARPVRLNWPYARPPVRPGDSAEIKFTSAWPKQDILGRTRP